ncbi:MAG: hypothetical protein M3430_03785 [Acidobacteriota bacterium]|nr:hypothetical protein [Acidobacteriota bacterium]
MGFDRATRKNPCPVCGAQKYCQVTRDRRLAHCMKESRGAVKRAKDGGHLHVLVEDTSLNKGSRPGTVTPLNTTMVSLTPPAPLEIRDAAYRKLLDLSPAWVYERELIVAVPDGLLARGLLPQDVPRFGALPPTVKDRDDLARSISDFIVGNFPAHSTEHLCAGVIGVPGFWEGSRGEAKLGKDFDYKRPALIIPYRNGQGLIQACQLRFSGAKGDYHWLSTSEDWLDREPKGVSSGSPIHWTFLKSDLDESDELPVLITEGALKAEVFVRLRSPMRAIATAGVGVGHAEIVRALSGCDALIGFDSDHRENAQVCRQLGKLIAEREMDARSNGQKHSTSVVVWEGAKGIDDAVRQNLPLRVVAIPEWIKTLGYMAEAVADIWRQYEFTPDAEQEERRTSSRESE